MGEVISLTESPIYPLATCECGSQHWFILVDGFNDQWNNIVGTKCAECGQIIEWVKAEKAVIDG